MKALCIFILFFLWPAKDFVLPGNSFVGNYHNDKKSALHFFPYLKQPSQKNKNAFDTSQLKQSDWYTQAINAIEAKEYGISFDKNKKNYTSPNRKQNLRAFYTANKFILQPRNDSTE